jgi:hypothetical protein
MLTPAMRDHLRQGLVLAQKLSHAKAQFEFARLWLGAPPSEWSRGPLDHAGRRIAECESALSEFMKSPAASLAARELKLCRALYLRMLLSSANARLATWSGDRDRDRDLGRGRGRGRMPRSQLYETVANRLERDELECIECSLSGVERTVYACLLAFYRSGADEVVD